MRTIASDTGIGRLKHVALSTFLAIAGTGPANAAPPPLPCSDEIARYCKNLGLGGGRVQNCLREHDAQLSPACRAGLESALARHREIQAACGADVERLCKDVRPGKGRLAACLKEHHREVSSLCKDTLAAARKAGSRTGPTRRTQGIHP